MTRPVATFELAQMVRCEAGPHHGRVGFVQRTGERTIDVRIFHRTTGDCVTLEQQRHDVWTPIQEPAIDVAQRLASWLRERAPESVVQA